jgi:large subunit ribosomal protein L31
MIKRLPFELAESHPFYTGTQKSVDNMGGRVERFRNRFGKK